MALSETAKQSIIYFIVALLAGSVGAVVVGNISSEGLTDLQFDSSYVCDVNPDLVGVYDRLSGTLFRAYPFEGTTKGYKDCKASDGTKGDWIPLKKFAEDAGIDPLEFMLKALQETEPEPAPAPPPSPSGVPAPSEGDYCCAPLPVGCKPKTVPGPCPQ